MASSSSSSSSSSSLTLACVGKPSAGKSSFLNAITDATAKVGNYPFTTIEPNHGVTYYPTECPCKRFGKTELCEPRYGRCVNGTRFVPVKIIDVAGLVPGAHEGKGLGNQFLNDLCFADALIHVVDVSGTTNEKGEETIGYDPINDIDWLRYEIHSWIYNNLKGRWGSIVRRHVATKSSPVETFQSQLSGYGANHALILRFCDKAFEKLNNKSMDTWDDADLRAAVDVFLDVRFPTVVACNKIDLPDSDKNINKIVKKYDESMLVFSSALSEIFLRKLTKAGHLRYEEGSDNVETYEDEEADKKTLKPLDEKNMKRLEKIRDLVLYRYGSTGTQETIRRAVENLNMFPVYPVRNINNFTSDGGQVRTGKVFRDCFLVQSGTTVKDVVHLLPGNMERFYNGAETVGGIQVSEDEVVTPERNIFAFKFGMYEQNDFNGS